MKKLLSIILVIAMLLSICVVNTFAYPTYQTVWTQNFENASDKAIGGGGTSTDTFLQTNAYASVPGAESATVAVGKRKKAGGESVIVKVFIDNSVLEEGATYKITAKVMHKDSNGERNIIVTPLKNTSYSAYSTEATKRFLSVPELTWTFVSSNEFVYNASNIESGSTLNVRFEVSSDGSVTTSQRFYLDNVKLVKCLEESDVTPTGDKSVFANYKLGETIDFENLSYKTLRKYADSEENVYDVDKNGMKYIMDDPLNAGQGKVLRGSAYKDGSYARNELVGILKNELDTLGTIKGEAYIVSCKLYPEGTSDIKIRMGFKTEISSATANAAGVELEKNVDFKENQWNDIKINVYIPATLSNEPINLYFDQRISGQSITNKCYDYIWIDDIKIEKLPSVFSGAGRSKAIDFEDTTTLIKGVDWTGNITGALSVVSNVEKGIGTEGNSLLINNSATDGNSTRVVLLDVFSQADKDTKMKISLKVYPTSDSEKGIRFGVKYHKKDDSTMDSHWGSNKYFPVVTGEELTANAWNEISFIVDVKNVSPGLTSCLAIDQRGTETVISDIYIDDIKIEPIDVSGKVVYISSTGSDTNIGFEETAPLKTFAAAYGTPVSKFVLLDNVEYTSPSYSRGELTIAGKISDVVLTLPETTSIKDNTKFENLILKGSAEIIYEGASTSDKKVTNSSSFFANGYTLEIADSVKSYNDGTTDSYFLVYGGCNNTELAGDTDLRIYGGKYVRIFGGGYASKGKVKGNTNVIVGGNVNSTDNAPDTICKIFAGGRNAEVSGSTNVTIKDNAVTKYLVGAGYSVYGTAPETNINIAGGKVMNVYAGSTSASITSNTNVTITGGQVEAIFGGSENYPMTGNTVINLLGGEVTRRVYGGCYNEFKVGLFSQQWQGSNCVTGTTNIVIGPNAQLNTGSGLSGTEKANTGVFAGSRMENNSASEVSTIIFIDDAYDTKSSQIGEKGSYFVSYFKSHTDYIVDASVGGDVVPSGKSGTINVKPDAGKYALVGNVKYTSGDVSLKAATTTVVFKNEFGINSVSASKDDTGAVVTVSFDAVNASGMKTPRLIAAVYSKGAVAGIKAIAPSSDMSSYTFDIDFADSDASGYTAKVFLWDGYNYPLTLCKETKVN